MGRNVGEKPVSTDPETLVFDRGLTVTLNGGRFFPLNNGVKFDLVLGLRDIYPESLPHIF